MRTRAGKVRPRQLDEIRPEYDLGRLKHPVRHNHHARAIAGSNAVLLDADVAAVFPTAEAVNAALRLLITVARASISERRRARRPA